MKLLFGGPGPLKLSGGTIMASLLMAATQRQGHEVATLTSEPAPEWWPPELPVFIGDYGSLPDLSTYDAIVTGGEFVAGAVAAGHQTVVQFCAGYEPDLWPMARERIDAIYRLPTLKAVIAPHIKRSIERDYGLEAVVVGSPVDLARFSPPAAGERADDSGRPLRVLTVGPEPDEPFAPVPFKGIADVLEIIRRARERGLELTLVRMTPYADALNESGQLDEVHVGVLPADTPAVYRSCDIYLGASTHAEGLGMPPFEAACSAVASVVPAIPSFLDVPALEGCALFYAPGELDEAVERLAELDANRTRLRRLQAAGPQSGLREYFDPAGVARRLVEAIATYRAQAPTGGYPKPDAS